jgi:nitrogen regulatory protein P-II 2
MTALHKHPRTLLVIVAEAALEKPLVREVRQHGGQFWTVAEVHGAGLEGVRDGDWEAIAHQVMVAYAPHFSVGLYFGQVEVLRPERY